MMKYGAVPLMAQTVWFNGLYSSASVPVDKDIILSIGYYQFLKIQRHQHAIRAAASAK